MTDTITTVGMSFAGTSRAAAKASLWGKSLDLTSLKANPKRWNRKWERLLGTLSAQEAYTRMSRLFRNEIWGKPGITLEQISSVLNEQICTTQGQVLDIWRKRRLGDELATAWVLLEHSEQERHMFRGLKDASETGLFHQDIRSLCPEIRTSLFFAHAGRTFTDFVEIFVVGRESAEDVAIPYLFPSAWWDSAGGSIVLEEFGESAQMFLTLLRNVFIGGFFCYILTHGSLTTHPAQFLAHTLMSLSGDLMNGGSVINPIKKLMEERPMYASVMGELISSQLNKPLIRCENCTKSREDLGDVQFKLCSACNNKLQFKIHYCSMCVLRESSACHAPSDHLLHFSRACQKQDWSLHKKHCGQQKVSKKLKGTAQDPFWYSSMMSDDFRSALESGDDIPNKETGFGPASAASSYSPALQHQVALLRADAEADYILFDIHGHPVRFVISDPMLKKIFRISRSDALTPSDYFGVASMAEYIVKVMGQYPGLSRGLIFAQLELEYGRNVEQWVARFVWASEGEIQPGYTFVENYANATPEINQIYQGWSRSKGKGGGH